MTFNWPYNTDERLRTLMEPQLSSASISHAYLFYGVVGSGKNNLMRAFARAIQCRSSVRPCGDCASCIAHTAVAHPDFVDIDLFSQGNQEITVDMVREFTRSLRRGPILAESKIGLINKAEKLTLVAANALLKILEEPPMHVVILLSSSDLTGMPATLLSRCQAIHVRRLPTQLMRSLYAATGTKSEKTEQCLMLSGGRTSAMDELIHGGLESYHERISLIIAMLKLFPSAVSQELDAFFRNEKKASPDGKVTQRFILELTQDLESVIRDVLVSRVRPDLIRNMNFKSEIRSLSQQLHPARALHLLRSLFTHYQAITQDSGNAQLHCEYLFLGV